MPVIAYLTDHKAETLTAWSKRAKIRRAKTAREIASSCWLPAAPVSKRRPTSWSGKPIQMLLLVYAAVIVLCLITFRSWRAVVVACSAGA